MRATLWKSTVGQKHGVVLQLDWRLTLIMDLQVASQTPLVEQ